MLFYFNILTWSTISFFSLSRQFFTCTEHAWAAPAWHMTPLTAQMLIDIHCCHVCSVIWQPQGFTLQTDLVQKVQRLYFPPLHLCSTQNMMPKAQDVFCVTGANDLPKSLPAPKPHPAGKGCCILQKCLSSLWGDHQSLHMWERLHVRFQSHNSHEWVSAVTWRMDHLINRSNYSNTRHRS